jgi:cadmium resistance protein CadD (predicted permease)
MESLSVLVGLAIVLFVWTNVDDLVVLIAFFADPAFNARETVAGQYAGITVLFAVSAAGALLSPVIPAAYLGLLGIFPIVIGIRKFFLLRQDRVPLDPITAARPAGGSYGNIAAVAFVTITNGGDNIGIYMPSLAVHSGSQIAIIALVFLTMTGLWCMLAYRLVSHPKFGAPVRRYAHIVSPVVLIAIGVLIIYNSGIIPSLLQRWGR